MPAMKFEKRKLIRFQLCDPAGIVFYPQYFILFHELMEDWFNEGLGGDYADFVVGRGMGLPIVKTECEFLAPNWMGDVLEMELVVKRLGTSSITLGVRGSAKGRDCVRATFTVVHTRLGEMQSTPIPEPLRSAMARYVV